MKKNLLMILICGMMILGLTTGCRKEETTSNNQQNEQINNQDNEEVKEVSPLTKIVEKLEKGDFSDIAGTYELAKYDTETYTGDNYKQYNNFNVQQIVIDEKGNIYKYSPYSGDTQFSIEEIEEETNWNYILLKNTSGDMLFVYPANMEYKDNGDEIPESWNDNTKIRIGAYFTEFTYNHGNLYYIQK